MIWDDFLIRAALAGIGVAIAAAPLGCFTIWRRMAYFGDATAHGALLGVALALAFALPIWLGVLVVALAIAVGMERLMARGAASDTALGVLAHGTLAAGLVIMALLPGARTDLSSLLFGDILSVRAGDLALIWGGAAIVVAAFAWRWSQLLTATLGADLARAAGIEPEREQLWVTLALAITVAVALKVVGALLIAAMLVLPAAAARPLARSPEAMVAITAMIGIASVLGGLALSLSYDTPTGPSIVSAAALIFAATHLRGTRRQA